MEETRLALQEGLILLCYMKHYVKISHPSSKEDRLSQSERGYNWKILTCQVPCKTVTCRPPKNWLFILVLSISRYIELWTFSVYYMCLQEGCFAVEHQILSEIWDFFFVLNGTGEQLVSVIFMTIFIHMNSDDKLSLLFSFIPAFLTLLEKFCFSF